MPVPVYPWAGYGSLKIKPDPTLLPGPLVPYPTQTRTRPRDPEPKNLNPNLSNLFLFLSLSRPVSFSFTRESFLKKSIDVCSINRHSRFNLHPNPDFSIPMQLLKSEHYVVIGRRPHSSIIIHQNRDSHMHLSVTVHQRLSSFVDACSFGNRSSFGNQYSDLMFWSLRIEVLDLKFWKSELKFWSIRFIHLQKSKKQKDNKIMIVKMLNWFNRGETDSQPKMNFFFSNPVDKQDKNQ
ncbi:unnamed protein product [Rhodiola kirilowii]